MCDMETSKGPCLSLFLSLVVSQKHTVSPSLTFMFCFCTQYAHHTHNTQHTHTKAPVTFITRASIDLQLMVPCQLPVFFCFRSVVCVSACSNFLFSFFSFQIILFLIIIVFFMFFIWGGLCCVFYSVQLWPSHPCVNFLSRSLSFFFTVFFHVSLLQDRGNRGRRSAMETDLKIRGVAINFNNHSIRIMICGCR